MSKIGTHVQTDEAASTPQAHRPADCSPLRPPALLAWLASAVTVSVIVVTQFLPRGGSPALRGMGVFLLLLAGPLMLWPLYLLAKRGGRDGQAYLEASCVTESGLYAVARHPQYLGYSALAWGFSLLSQHWVALLLAAAASLLFHLQAVREEKYCIDRFGASYERYRRRVPRYNVILGIIRFLRGGGQ
jgi:protein-S-isoprenylcysteine O-methyltransferase Ste14